jgi:hypothetical protein
LKNADKQTGMTFELQVTLRVSARELAEINLKAYIGCFMLLYETRTATAASDFLLITCL